MSPEPSRTAPPPVAVVTGASRGIGSAIALALASVGGTVALVGRHREALAEAARGVERRGARALCFVADLAIEQEAERLGVRITESLAAADVLVHSAGCFPLGTQEATGNQDPFQVNVVAPERLTLALLPLLRVRRGQVVFINSSLGRPGLDVTGPYAKSKQALRGLADRLRCQLNPEGIRVLSVYPGRTATPLQAAIHAGEGKEYHPELLLQPEDIAGMIVHALALPRTAEVTDLSIRPLQRAEEQ